MMQQGGRAGVTGARSARSHLRLVKGRTAMKKAKANPARRLVMPASAVSRRRFLEAAGAAGGAAAFLVAKTKFLRAQAAGEPLKIGCKGQFTGPASRTGD